MVRSRFYVGMNTRLHFKAVCGHRLPRKVEAFDYNGSEVWYWEPGRAVTPPNLLYIRIGFAVVSK